MARLLIVFSIVFSSSILAHASCLDCSKKVLHIGDSQTDLDFGKKLFQFLTAHFEKKEISLLGVSSSSPRHWGSDKTSKDGRWLCARFGRSGARSRIRMRGEVCDRKEFPSPFSEANKDVPGHVFFQFLGNSMGLSRAQVKKNIKNLLGQLQKSQQCFFMTSPPYHVSLGDRNDLRAQTEQYIIEAIGERCAIFEGMSLKNLSKDKAHYKSDLIHLNHKGAQKFLDAMRPSLLKFLSGV